MKYSAYIEDLVKLGLVDSEPCSGKENEIYRNMPDVELPKEVYAIRSDGFAEGSEHYARFYGMEEPDAKLLNKISAHIAVDVKSIRKCAVFFVVLSVISLITTLVSIFF